LILFRTFTVAHFHGWKNAKYLAKQKKKSERDKREGEKGTHERNRLREKREIEIQRERD